MPGSHNLGKRRWRCWAAPARLLLRTARHLLTRYCAGCVPVSALNTMKSAANCGCPCCAGCDVLHSGRHRAASQLWAQARFLAGDPGQALLQWAKAARGCSEVFPPCQQGCAYNRIALLQAWLRRRMEQRQPLPTWQEQGLCLGATFFVQVGRVPRCLHERCLLDTQKAIYSYYAPVQNRWMRLQLQVASFALPFPVSLE